MSRQDREQRRVRANAGYGTTQPPPPYPGVEPAEAPSRSLRDRLDEASPAAIALLPIRAFFGVTFVYAGIDKLIDPAFFDASSPASIVAQLNAFAHVSPLAPLIKVTEPFAIPIGLLIALAEIAIGLGALTGLAFRLAALGGTVLSLMFWLTASWGTHPYYYGPDLPYAFGWMALAIAGHGDLLVPAAVRRLGMSSMDAWDRARAGGYRGGQRPRGMPAPDPGANAARRLVLQAGVLGAASLAVASMAAPVRFFRGPASPSTADAGNGGDAGTGAGAGADAGAATDAPAATGPGTATATPGGPAATATPGGAFTPSGLTVASTASVDAKGAIRIRVPANAPASLPAGDPAIIVKLANGSYVAYDAICTHEGCKVAWDARDGVMLCPCHGAAFDPNNHGAVLAGPTNQPLPELPLIIDHQAGTITLKA